MINDRNENVHAPTKPLPRLPPPPPPCHFSCRCRAEINTPGIKDVLSLAALFPFFHVLSATLFTLSPRESSNIWIHGSFTHRNAQFGSCVNNYFGAHVLLPSVWILSADKLMRINVMDAAAHVSADQNPQPGASERATDGGREERMKGHNTRGGE